MIELFTFGSTNGHKIAIALEELALPYLRDPRSRHHANLAAWFERIGARPAVTRGVTIPSRLPEPRRASAPTCG